MRGAAAHSRREGQVKVHMTARTADGCRCRRSRFPLAFLSFAEEMIDRAAQKIQWPTDRPETDAIGIHPGLLVVLVGTRGSRSPGKLCGSRSVFHLYNAADS